MPFREWNSAILGTFLRRQPIRANSTISESAQDRSDLQVGFQTVAAVFAAYAGLFEAAKRRQGFVRCAINHHTTGLQPLSYLTRVRHISALDISLEAVGCVVGDCDRLLFVVVGD